MGVDNGTGIGAIGNAVANVDVDIDVDAEREILGGGGLSTKASERALMPGPSNSDGFASMTGVDCGRCCCC